MNMDLGIIWDRLTRMVVFLLFLAGLLAVAAWYLPLIKENERFRRQILRFDADIRQEEETARGLKSAIEALRHDPKAVERLARESLAYGKPGETIVRFDSAPAATNAPGR